MGYKHSILAAQGHEHRLVGELGVDKARVHPDIVGLLRHSGGEDRVGEVASFHESLAVEDSDLLLDAIDDLRSAVEGVLNPAGVEEELGLVRSVRNLSVGKVFHELDTALGDFLGDQVEVVLDVVRLKFR